jgi:hypothetical protein
MEVYCQKEVFHKLVWKRCVFGTEWHVSSLVLPMHSSGRDKQERQRTYNATVRRVRLTIVAVEKK